MKDERQEPKESNMFYSYITLEATRRKKNLFPVNFEKYLRTPFLHNTSRRRLL